MLTKKLFIAITIVFVNFPAISSADFVSGSQNLTFPSGSSDNDSQCLEIVIVDDSALESDELFTVTFASAQPFQGNNMSLITIVDNDSIKL